MFKIIRKLLAKHKYKVPFQLKTWYNYQLALRSYDESTSNRDYVIVIDKDNRYIKCPQVGGLLTYRIHGEDYQYIVVGFDNESPRRDWLYPTDYINPIIQFVKKLS